MAAIDDTFHGDSAPAAAATTVRPRRRLVSLFLALVAACLLAWTFVVWRWQDPFTALYALHQQRGLAAAYEQAAAQWGGRPAARGGRTSGAVAALAARYRRSLGRGDPVGRLEIERLDLNLVVGNGADDATLRAGPGRDRRSAVPGEGELVYVAGHRTTYLAPFSRLDALRRGDRITFEVPYATFTYAVTHRVVVDESDVSVLRSAGRELLALQTCHPRFFATKRYVVFARIVAVDVA